MSIPPPTMSWERCSSSTPIGPRRSTRSSPAAERQATHGRGSPLTPAPPFAPPPTYEPAEAGGGRRVFARELSMPLSVPTSMTTSVTQNVPVGQVHRARRMREGVVHHESPPLLSGMRKEGRNTTSINRDGRGVVL